MVFVFCFAHIKLSKSNDFAATWCLSANGANQFIGNQAFGVVRAETFGLFVATGWTWVPLGPTANTVSYSSDGITWTPVRNVLNSVDDPTKQACSPVRHAAVGQGPAGPIVLVTGTASLSFGGATSCGMGTFPSLSNVAISTDGKSYSIPPNTPFPISEIASRNALSHFVHQSFVVIFLDCIIQ
jgi:hypothetical protein